MGPLDLPKSKQRIALLTSTNAADKRLDMALLNERGALLADARDEVAQMRHDLADLLRAL
jgi:septum formation topological specificity factor MinE